MDPKSASRSDPATAGPEDRARHEALTDRARERHDALTLAIERLEHALARPAAQRAGAWAAPVGAALSAVQDAVRSHVEGVEEPGGLFAEVRRAAPRLDRRVGALEEEHLLLVGRCSALAERLAGPRDVDFGLVRRQAAALLGDLRAHRAAEADLVYEAFWTDLGAVD